MKNKKFRIEFDSDACIGSANCISIDPVHFEFNGQKAVLKEAKEVDEGFFSLWSENDMQKALKAAKICPVKAIKILDENGREIK